MSATDSAILGMTSLLVNLANPRASVAVQRTQQSHGIRAGIHALVTTYFRGLLYPNRDDLPSNRNPIPPISSVETKTDDETNLPTEVSIPSPELPVPDLSSMVAGMLSDPGNNFSVEVQGVLSILLAAFEERRDSSIRDLKGDDAQLAVNVMQEALNTTRSGPSTVASPDIVEAQMLLRRRLHGLSQRSEKVPACYHLQDIKCPSRQIYGAGGFADVYRGTCKEEQVALKHLRAFNLYAPTEKRTRERSFYRETVLWYNVSHPHVLPFKGVAEIPDIGLCMVSPWMPNGNVRTHLQRMIDYGGLSGKAFVDTVNRMLYDIALGLEYLHSEDIVHGDLRGPNVLVDDDGTLRLTDFGLSVIAEVGLSYTSLNVGGAVGYASPELIEAEKPRPTIASDIYAFGHVCVELYSGLPPYQGSLDRQIPLKIMKGEKPPRPSTAGKEMNDVLWNMVNRCWDTDPNARPHMTEVLGILKSQCGL